MHPADVDTYGGIKVDRYPARRRDTDVVADQWNRLCETSAQMTRTSPKALVQFTCTAAAAPADVTPDWWSTQWGTAVADRPTVSKVATGKYSITFPSSKTDGLGNSETLSFGEVESAAWTADDDDVCFSRCRSVAAYIVNVLVFEGTSGPGTVVRADTVTASGLAAVVFVAIYE